MAGKQLGFCDYEQSKAKSASRRRNLAEMDQVVPW